MIGILKLTWVSYSVFFLLEMQNVALSLLCLFFFLLLTRASDPAWVSSEMSWAFNFGGCYFFLPPSQPAKQELCSGNLAIMLTGLGGLSSLESYAPQQAFLPMVPGRDGVVF